MSADSYAEVFRAMARELADGDFEEYENGAFFNYVGEYMLDWLAALDELRSLNAAPLPADD